MGISNQRRTTLLLTMNVRFSGFGGQGVVLAGVIYGRAATIDGKNAVQTQSYGSASRGGACKSDIIVADEEIYELEFPVADVLVAMSQEAYQKYGHQLKEGGLLIVDSDLVTLKPQNLRLKTYALPATDIAFKKFGQKIMANMVMLGYLSAILPIVSKEAIIEAIRENVPRVTEDKNIAAFDEGYKLGIKAVKLEKA